MLRNSAASTANHLLNVDRPKPCLRGWLACFAWITYFVAHHS